MALNRGEWSEIYTILYLLLNPDIAIVDSMLECIETGLYSVKEINTTESNPTKYLLNGSDNVQIINNNEVKLEIKKEELNESVDELFSKIMNNTERKGAFEVVGINDSLQRLLDENTVKSPSFSKVDLIAGVFDNRMLSDIHLSYSVKSSLGSPATILNASQHTNFFYEVEGINVSDIENINNINTNTKLKDRISKIYELGGEIKFLKVQSETFEYNLKMIDSSMPKYLGNVLLASYKNENKNLKELFLESNEFADEEIATKKLADLLDGISFGFFPSKKWDGQNEINGGLLIVKRDGTVVSLDLIYYKNHVLQYLLNETKLDSPSSSRYNMLQLFEKNGKIFFTLNIQIRYKN